MGDIRKIWEKLKIKADETAGKINKTVAEIKDSWTNEECQELRSQFLLTCNKGPLERPERDCWEAQAEYNKCQQNRILRKP